MANDKTQIAAGKAPTHITYQVREGSGKSYWSRIGAAWAHSDGEGFSIQLDAMPLDGKIVLRLPSETR